MSHYAHFAARVKRCRKLIPAKSREECLAESASVRRAAEIAAFMGDDQATSSLLYAFSDELREAADKKGTAK